MRQLTRPLCLLIGVQAICLGIGFWFQYQLVASTIDGEAMEMAWSELAAQSESVASIVQKQTGPNLDWAQFSKLASLSESSNQPAVILTDSQGMILGFNQPATAGGWNLNQRMAWKANRAAATVDGPQYGRVVTAAGDRTAVIYPVRKQDRQVIFYSTAPTAPSWLKSLQSSLPIAGGLGFFWTFSLSAGAIVLLIQRFNFQNANRKAEMDHDALKNAQDLLRTRDAVIFGLAKLAESRDAETGHHLERISLYTTRLGTALRPYPKYQRTVTPTFVRLLGISSVLHDIGKVGVEDTVLLKPGKLTDEERLRMQQHTLVAGDCLKEIEQRLGASNFLQTAREIALHHHERWDGLGYPYGLSGANIPLAARIVSIADVYDALSSKRVYKDAFPHEECVNAIRAGAGTQFDPELVEVFLEIESEFAAIARRFAIANSPTPAADAAKASGSESSTTNKPLDELFESIIGGQQPTEVSRAIVTVA